MEHMRFEAAELLTTGQCPFNCRYCYIPKTSAMKNLHRDIIRDLKNNTFLDNLEKVMGKNLVYFSFWGTEPALTLKILQSKLKEISQRFPKLKQISFSTSMMLPEAIIDFAKALSKFNVELDAQVSLDGPAFITDKNRFLGAAKKIPENFFKLVNMCQNISTKLDLRWKSTLTIDNIKEMNAKPGKIDDYFHYFQNLNQKFKKINQNKNITLQDQSYLPTLAVPGKYTSEDGKEFAKFLQKLHQKKYRSAYSNRLDRLLKFYDELGNKRKMFTCSGGDSNIGIGSHLHICHRTFYLDEDKYVESVLKEKDIENWDVSFFRAGTIDYLRKWYMPSVDKEIEKMKFDYIMRGYHDFWALAMASTEALVKELALCGQAELIFLENKNYLTIFNLFTNTCLSCPMENILNTGCVSFTPISILRLFGNGAFREIFQTT